MALFLLTFQGTLPSGEQFQHGLHCEGSISAADAATAAATALEDAISGNTAGMFRTDCTWDQLTTATLNTGTDRVSASRVDALAVAGSSSAGTSCPPQVAIVATLRTASAGPRYRGRFYLPSPITSDLNNDGTLGSTYVGYLASSWGTAFADLTGSGLTPVVRSRKFHSSANVTHVDFDTVLDTQRRRRKSLRGSTNGFDVS